MGGGRKLVFYNFNLKISCNKVLVYCLIKKMELYRILIIIGLKFIKNIFIIYIIVYRGCSFRGLL